jgi:catechol 2,3-dioxygenase-like lactoylglutathione lyase family enzyme
MTTEFVGIHLTVADMARSVAFYRDVGLLVPEDAESSPHVEIELVPGVRLALSSLAVTRAYDPGWRTPSRPPSGALQFELESREAVDELYAELVASGYHGHLPPSDAFWGSRYAEVDDPDGNIVGFHSPRDTAYETMPVFGADT